VREQFGEEEMPAADEDAEDAVLPRNEVGWFDADEVCAGGRRSPVAADCAEQCAAFRGGSGG
jgi:hypothetical protein